MAIEQVVVHQLLQGQMIQNSFLIGKEQVINDTERTAAIEAIVMAYEQYLAPVMHPNWSLTHVTRRNVSVNGMPIIAHASFSIVGEDPGEPMANTVAGIVHFLANTTRPNRSTKYLSGFGAGRLDTTGRFDSVALAAMQDWASTLMELGLTYDDHPLLVGRFYQGTSEIHMANAISNYRVAPIPGTRKSRRIGVGS